jgi:hypothetical protein
VILSAVTAVSAGDGAGTDSTDVAATATTS